MTSKSSFSVIIFFVILGKFSAQNNVSYSDSMLLHTADRSLQGEALFDYRLKVIDSLLNENMDSAAILIEQNMQLAKQLSKPYYIAAAWKYYGLLNHRRGEYIKAREQIQKAIQIEKKNHLEIPLAESYRWLAGIYYKLGLPEKSITYLYKALKIYDRNKNYRGLVSSYNNLGILEKEVGRYREAIHNYRKALKIVTAHHVPYDLADIYNNMGISYRYLKQADSSYYFLKLASLDYKKNKNFDALASAYLNLSKLFIDSQQKDSVEYYFRKIQYYFNRTSPSLHPLFLSTFGKWYYKTGQYDKAIGYLKRAYEIGKWNKSLRDKEYALYYLYVSYRDKGDYKNSLFYLEKLMDVQDSVKRVESRIKIEQLKKEYEDEKKQLIIRQLKADKIKQKKIKYLLSVVLVLLLLILVGIVLYYKKQRKLSRMEKEKMRVDLEYKSKQLTSQALMMMQKNKILNDVLHFLSRIKNNHNPGPGELNQFVRQVKAGLQAEKDWEVFRQYFEMVNKDFFKRLKQQFPDLTQSELKLSALIKLRFNIKQSATLLNISPDSVKTARYILRKKFGLKRNENLYDFLNEF